MPIYKGSTGVTCQRQFGSNSYSLPFFVKTGGGKVIQPGNGAVYGNVVPDSYSGTGGIKRSNVTKTNVPYIGTRQGGSTYGYQQGTAAVGSSSYELYDYGFSVSSSIWYPTTVGSFSSTPIITGTNAYTNNNSANAYTIKVDDVNKRIFGFKIAPHTNTISVEIWVFTFKTDSGFSIPSNMYIGWVTCANTTTYATSGRAIMDKFSSGVFRKVLTFSGSSTDTNYFSMPICPSFSPSLTSCPSVITYVSYRTSLT